jgi:predicted dehydrogenase
VEVHGTVGHAIANNVPPNPVKAALQMLTMSKSASWQPYVSELAYFVDTIAHDMQPFPSGVDGLKDLEAIETAYRNSLQLKQQP